MTLRARPLLAAVALSFVVGCPRAPVKPLDVARPATVAPASADAPLEPDLDLFAAPTEEEMLIRRESTVAASLVEVGRRALAETTTPPLTPREADALSHALERIAAYDYEAAFGWLSALHFLRKPMPPVVSQISARLSDALLYPGRTISLRNAATSVAAVDSRRPSIDVRLVDELARASFDSEWLEDHALVWAAKLRSFRPARPGPRRLFDFTPRDVQYPSMTVGLLLFSVQRPGSRILIGFELGMAPGTTATWAEPRGDVLYASFSARDVSDADHGALLAVDLGRPGGLIWRSRPRACTARTFAVVTDVIVCGGEDARGRPAVVVVDRNTGAIAAEVRVEDPPRAVLAAGERVFVRGERRDLEVVLGPAKR